MKKIELTSIILERTCLACPEQYDAYLNHRKMGYLRLRHGTFTVSENPVSSLISSYQPEGDGAFMDNERTYYLCVAVSDLLNTYNGEFECLKPIKIVVS